MRRALPYLAALLLGAATAVAVGCGDRSHLVPPRSANEMTAQLASAKAAIAAGQCAEAKAAVDAGFHTATQLPGSVDRRLRERINDGFQALENTYAAACADAKAQQTQPQTTTTETNTTDTTPTETNTTPTETTPTDTVPAEPSTPTPSTSEPPSTGEPPTTTDPGTGGTAEGTATP